MTPNHQIRLLFVVMALWSVFAFGINPLEEQNQRIESLSPTDHEIYRKVADQLRCPTCTGLSILQSDTPFSMQLKKALLDQLPREKNPEQLVSFFTERYGQWILREPPKTGFHLWIAWWIPIGFILVGMFGLWFFVWRDRRTEETAGIRSRTEILEEMERKIHEGTPK